MVKGIGASSGIAIGKAFVLPTWEWSMPESLADATDLAFEFEKLYDGIRISKNEIEHLKQDIYELIGPEESHIFDAHLAILEDPVFMAEVQQIMKRQSKAAVVAVKEAMDKFIAMFDLLDDDYMKERAADIKDVGSRLLKHLLGGLRDTVPPADHPYILVAKELVPSHMVNLDPNRVLGIVALSGGLTSHAAIMARAMGIPFVLGVEGKLPRPIQTGDFLIIDGDEGNISLNPDAETIAEYEERKRRLNKSRERLQRLASVPTMTADGFKVGLRSNIGSIKELEAALENGAEGVGLFRTEFIFLERQSLPSEEEQFEIYRQVAERLAGKELIIRTLDVGGDKNVDFIAFPEEDNPSLGYRAIRVSLVRTDVFKTQLKAILRAALHGNIKIMYPMIASVEEVRQANQLLEEAKRELRMQNVPFRERLPVGIMIEVPAAAAMADLLADEVDFFSIGTNDLVQYMLAVDRMNDAIAHLYEPFHPAVLRLLKHTAGAAKRCGIPIGVCGELAGDPLALPIWLGLGITELSMTVRSILPIKERVLRLNRDRCDELFERVTKLKTSTEIRALLQEAENELEVGK